MALTVGGIAIGAFGLLAKGPVIPAGATAGVSVSVPAPEDAPLGTGHWRLMIARGIDVMKPATPASRCRA